MAGIVCRLDAIVGKTEMRCQYWVQHERLLLVFAQIIDGYISSSCPKRNTQCLQYEDNWLMPFREIIALYVRNNIEHINIMCVRNIQRRSVIANGAYCNGCTLKC
jgi:hypothetical protein